MRADQRVRSQRPSQKAFNYLTTHTWWTLTQELDNIGGTISGGLFGLGLPAGEITAALSAEMRWRPMKCQTNSLPTDFVNCTGLRMCTANGGAAPVLWTQNVNAPVSADNNVYEIALEVNVPLLKDVPMVQDLSADVAGRYTNYSISGETQTWKIGINWQVDEHRVPRHHVDDIRAPNLNDLFQPMGISSTGFTDLLTSGQQQHPAGHPGQCHPDAGGRPHLYAGHGVDAGIHPRLHLLAGLVPDPYVATRYQHQLSNHAVQKLCIPAHPPTIRPIVRWRSVLSRPARRSSPRRPIIRPRC